MNNALKTNDATLGELVEIIAGYSDRDKPWPAPGLFRILLARDLRANGSIAWDQLDPCERKPGAERALLRDGDLLLTTRSAEPRTCRITEPPADVVAGAPFAILRATNCAVDFDFLHWFLGTDAVRERLRGMLRGSSMPFLSVADVASLPVLLPPLARQRAIARVHALRARLTDLSNRLDRSIGLLLEQAATSSHD